MSGGAAREGGGGGARVRVFVGSEIGGLVGGLEGGGAGGGGDVGAEGAGLELRRNHCCWKGIFRSEEVIIE